MPADFKLNNRPFYVMLLALIAGGALSVISWLELCTETCAEGHHYRLFGLQFEIIGIAYFVLTIAALILSRSIPKLNFIVGLLLAAGIGAELMFIFIQKFVIGHWCPVCLAIATSVAIASIAFSIDYYNHSQTIQGASFQIQSMRRWLFGCAVLIFGFLIAFIGTSKIDDSNLSVDNFEEKIALGNQDSTTEVYVFTSWICPACRRFEPSLERIAPKLFPHAKVIFIDVGEDPKTMNFLPFNLSFLINNKEKYLDLRHMLSSMASETDTPSEEQIEKEAKLLNTSYKQLNYSEVASAMTYYRDILDKYKVDALPAIIIHNSHKNKDAKFSGANHILSSDLLKAID